MKYIKLGKYGYGQTTKIATLKFKYSLKKLREDVQFISAGKYLFTFRYYLLVL